jgi:hypothetical protein
MNVFSLVISLVTIGSVVITVNSKLLGGKVYVTSGDSVVSTADAQIVLSESCELVWSG